MMTVLNAFDCELTANSLAIHCLNNATINLEPSNVDFLLNKWDGENGLTIEIPCWEYETPDSVNIPVSVMKKLRLIQQSEGYLQYLNSVKIEVTIEAHLDYVTVNQTEIPIPHYIRSLPQFADWFAEQENVNSSHVQEAIAILKRSFAEMRICK